MAKHLNTYVGKHLKNLYGQTFKKPTWAHI